MGHNPIEIYKVKDKNEKHYTKKNGMFDLAFRLLIVGKSFLSGKTNLLLNFLLQNDPRLYKQDFKGDNIYIFSASVFTDDKMRTLVEEKEIPSNNLFDTYDEEVVDTLYELMKEEFNEKIRENEKPENKLIIFDDMSFGGNLKKKGNGAIAKIFCNGRHILLSSIITAQKYTDILTTCRENMTGGIFFKCSEKQLDLIESEHNFLENKKDFRHMFRVTTEEPHSFMVVNYTNPPEQLYMNKNFEAIGKCGGVKGKSCNCD